jgi:hypothetical protein
MGAIKLANAKRMTVEARHRSATGKPSFMAVHAGSETANLPPVTLGSSFTEWETVMDQIIHVAMQHIPWNKGKLVGQKAPLKLKEIWAIRIRLQLGNRTRELALFNLAIDSKLRACDLVKLRVRDVCHGNLAAARAIVMQQKTQRPVQSASRWGHSPPSV